MAYLGRIPATGENNAFRILDDVSSFVLTFDGSSANTVSLANDTIALSGANNRFITGQRVVYSKGAGGTIITGLAEGAHYVVRMSDTTIKLAPTANDALNQTNLRNFTGLGAGTAHKLTLAFDGINTKFRATYGNGSQKPLITRSAQLVLSINGVIQQPVDSTTPSVGFGFDVGGVIIFSTAPSASDAFWGHVLASNTVTFDISDNDIDKFTGNGTTTEFNLSKKPPDNRNILVTIDGVIQYPSDNTDTKAYGLSENKLQFTSAPANGADIQVRHIGFAGASGGGGGGGTGGVSSFYGRTGAVVLKSTDNPVIGNLTAVDATFSGNVAIAKTLTYMDVSHIDAVGVSTFQDDVQFNGTGVGISSLTWDKSANSLDFKDGIKARFGDSQDLQIFHSGAHSFIKDTGTGMLKICADMIDFRNAADNATLAYAQEGNKFELFHNGNSRLETTSTGVIVNDDVILRSSGELILNNAGNSANAKILCDGGARINIQSYAKSMLTMENGQPTIFYTSNETERLRIQNDGKVGIGTNVLPQQLTSFTVSGYPILAQGTSAAIGIGPSAIVFGNKTLSSLATGIIDGTDHIFKISGTEKLRIDSSGRLLIGTTTEGNSVADDLTIAGSGDSGITIRSGTSNEGSLMFSDATSGSAEYAGWVCYNHNSNFMRFFTNATERLRITGSGDVLIGATSSTTVSGAGTPFQVSGSDAYTGMSIIRTASAGAQFQFASGSNGDNVSNNDALGYFKFFGYHTNGYDEYARIHAEVDGTNGDGDAPGAIVFSTTADGASSVTERLRIDKNGDMCLGGTPFSQGTGNTFCIHSSGTGGGDHAYLYFTTGDSGHSASDGMSIGLAANQVANVSVREAWPFAVSTNGSERLRIESNGRIAVGGFSGAGSDLHIKTAASPTVRLQDTTNDCILLSYAQDSNAHVGTYSNHDLIFDTNSTEKLRITSAGKVLIGTTTPQGNANADDLVVSTSGHSGITIRSGTSHNSNLFFADGTSGGDEYRGWVDYKHNDNAMSFGTNAGERLRITSNGALLIGTDTPNYGSGDMQHEIKKNNTRQYTAPLMTSHPHLLLNNSDVSSAGSFTGLGFRAGSGDGSIGFVYQGTNAADFVINTDANLNGKERLRINNNGQMGINATTWTDSACPLSIYNGTTNSEHCLVDVIADTNETSRIVFSELGDHQKGYIQYHHGNRGDYMSFHTNGNSASRMSIGTGGNKTTVGFSTTLNLVTNSEVISVRGYSSFKSTSASYAPIFLSSEATGSTIAQMLMFNNGGANRGGIGYVPNTGELRFNNQYFLSFNTGTSALGGSKRLEIASDGQIFTASNNGSKKTYPILGGANIGTNDDEIGQFNYHDFRAPTGTIGGWVLLGLDYYPASPWPVRAFKIAAPESGVEGTRVYQVWHDGDANYDYGGMWEVRINQWTSNARFESVSIRCINGKRDDLRVWAYQDSNGIWLRPSTIWGQVFIRRAGWDTTSQRQRGSSYCAVANGAALAIRNNNNTGGEGNFIAGYTDVYAFNGSTATGGYDIENNNTFNG